MTRYGVFNLDTGECVLVGHCPDEAEVTDQAGEGQVAHALPFVLGPGPFVLSAGKPALRTEPAT